MPVCYYLLKVILCSGVLLGYYWLFLRNKVFHRYNRFYLLAAVVLSISLPLVKIPISQKTEAAQNQVLVVIRLMTTGDEYAQQAITSPPVPGRNITARLATIVYISVSLLLGLFFLYGLGRILWLIMSNTKKKIGSVRLIETEAHGTPFSFFRYIFWNKNISLETNTGQQVFRHELAHVREKHSYDKLFINAVLLLFWCNPFYWLTRRELSMIHEFTADQEAVKDHDTTTLATMILQAAYPTHRFELGNHFFHSPVKRRLVMLTKTNNIAINYLVRLLAFLLVCTITVCFTLRTEQLHAESRLNTILNASPFDLAVTPPGQQVTVAHPDTLPAPALRSMRVKAGNENIQLNADSIVFVPGATDAVKGPDKSILIINGVTTNKQEVSDARIVARMIKIYPANDAEAIRKYGADARFGVIECNNAEIIRNKTGNLQVAVALDKMNVMYMGIENPLTIAVSGIPSNELEVRMDNGTITGSNGKYIARVTAVGEAAIHVSSKGKLLGSTVYRVKRLPDPSDQVAFSNTNLQMDYQVVPRVGIDGVHTTRMKVEDILKAGKLTAGTGYDVESAIVYFSGAGFPIIQTAYLKGNDLNRFREYLDRCVAGSVVTFDMVEVKGDNGRKATIDGFSIAVY